MTIFVKGGYSYDAAYVIEQDGELFGPFVGQVEAHTFALERLDLPYTVRDVLAPKPEGLAQGKENG